MAMARTLEPRELILKCDKDLPREEQTIFYIRPLTAAETARIDDMTSYTTVETANGSRAIVGNMASVAIERVKIGLTGWSNFRDAAGQGIPFEKSLDRLFGSQILEISEAIDALNRIPEDQSKN